MNSKDIKTGETYFFVGTDSSARKHLEGTEFTVFEIKHVWRRRNKKSRQVKRFFNEFGEGARAEELEPLDTPICAMPPAIGLKIAGFAPACERSEHWPKTGHPAKISEKDYLENDGNPF